jgi:hypothetical protein
MVPLLLLLFLFSACKKSLPHHENPATLQPVNLLDNGVVLRANLSGKHPIQYRAALELANKSFAQRNIFVENFPQKLDLYAQPDTMPGDHPVISADLQLEAGKIYSMFIHGEKANATYSILEDKFPPTNVNDSLTQIRFANFSESQPVSVNIKGEAPGSYIQSLPFKSASDFMALKVTPNIPNYEFEIRDEASGNLLTTYTIASSGTVNFILWIYRPHTLIFTGRVSGTGADQQKIVVMKHR